MIININPNRLTNPGAVRPQVRGREREKEASESKAKPASRFSPKLAEENFIPEPESLATRIRSAVSALREGLHWDRGTILNLLV